MVKNPPVNVGDLRDGGSIPREGNGNPLQWVEVRTIVQDAMTKIIAKKKKRM